MDENDIRAVISVKTTCKILKLSRSCVYHLIQNGEIPALRFGGSIRILWEPLRRKLHLNPDGTPETTVEEDALRGDQDARAGRFVSREEVFGDGEQS